MIYFLYNDISDDKTLQREYINWFNDIYALERVAKDLENPSVTVYDEGIYLRDYNTLDDIVDAISQMEIKQSMKNEHTPVDPGHYKGYISDLQWLDAMKEIPTLRDPERFVAALELQIRKYLDRNGQKDNPIQELKKARFYLQYLIDYIENDGVVFASEVHEKLPK